ncbi:hypothetical protein AB0E01_24525 [Nocardia vinacea]|uniref:hypothetical protein n=1 Tax=Nocardia vinacea TaxID=96468 RepID=UPI003410252E
MVAPSRCSCAGNRLRPFGFQRSSINGRIRATSGLGRTATGDDSSIRGLDGRGRRGKLTPRSIDRRCVGARRSINPRLSLGRRRDGCTTRPGRGINSGRLYGTDLSGARVPVNSHAIGARRCLAALGRRIVRHESESGSGIGLP